MTAANQQSQQQEQVAQTAEQQVAVVLAPNPAFDAIVAAVTTNNRRIIDDETGEEIEVIGVGLVVQRKNEFAVPLFTDYGFNHLRSIYLEEDGKPHLDVYTIGGTLYEDEVPDLVDLQHHKLTVGTLVRTWIFGKPNGGCNPRLAPVEETKTTKKPAAGAKKADKKDDKKDKPKFNAPQRRGAGLGNAVPAKRVEQAQAPAGEQQQAA